MNRYWLMVVLLAAGVPAAAGDMYSWTDANGVKHFSDSPPPPSVVGSQKVKMKGGVTSATAAAVEEARKDETAKASGPALAAAAGYPPEDIKRNCSIARKNLASLDAQPLPVDKSGNPVDPEAAKDRAGQTDKVNQQIKLFCGA
jgi:Domain of unknown function (DUF4124)